MDKPRYTPDFFIKKGLTEQSGLYIMRSTSATEVPDPP